MSDTNSGAWEHRRATMGAFIRSQREMANMSLRQLAQATQVSNAYLSQIERGLHDPTVRVLVQIGQALHLSLEDMLSRDAPRAESADPPGPDVEAAVRADSRLTAAEREALLAVYRSYVSSHEPAPSAPDAPEPAPEPDADAPAVAPVSTDAAEAGAPSGPARPSRRRRATT